MAPSIGVNLRVTGHCDQGDRKYMEDVFSVAYQHTKEGQDLEYAYFGIFDGHGGKHAAIFAKEHLMDNIVSNPYFWSDNDEDVLKAIKEGFLITHQAMFRVLDSWPKTVSGLPSTSGTTASIAFIRRGKIFTGHVGDSGIVLGYQDPDSGVWHARPLTQDHKPESAMEIGRIQEAGGKVVWKAGVPRVVWNRPKIGHQGPVLRSTHIDEIPFLAVARSLGDLWSFNSASNQFVVSPEPDVNSMTIDVTRHRCLILGTDGLWNMIPPQRAVEVVQHIDRQNKMHHNSDHPMPWTNPSKRLVNTALDYWMMNKLRADNCTAVTALLDPPGPPLSGLLASSTLCTSKPEEVEPPSPDVTSLRVSDGETDDPTGCKSSLNDSANQSSSASPELNALLSAPVIATNQCMAPNAPLSPSVLEASLPLGSTPPPPLNKPTSEPLRVLRTRTPASSSIDNRKSPAVPVLGASLRKKVVVTASLPQQQQQQQQQQQNQQQQQQQQQPPLCGSRKRPMTRSFHDLSEDRNASDTENQVQPEPQLRSSGPTVAKRKSRPSMPLPTSSQRILRSGASPSSSSTPHLQLAQHPSVVRTLRSQDSNPRLMSSSNPTVVSLQRRKRSRSFTPIKRRR